MRTKALLACVLVGVLAAPADAKVYCNLAREKPDDHAGTAGVPPRGPHDLKSFDLASNATHLTGVVRVRDVDETGVAAPVVGARYRLAFSVDEERHFMLVARLGGGYDDFALYQEHSGWVAPEDEHGGVWMGEAAPVLLTDRVRAVVDARTDEIRMTVPLSAFGRGVLTRGKRLYRIGGNVAATAGQLDEDQRPGWRYVLSSHQDALSARRLDAYPLGARSCVRVGR